ncbi:unnamed protein product, partial [Phaeothamnion confervicola]
RHHPGQHLRHQQIRSPAQRLHRRRRQLASTSASHKCNRCRTIVLAQALVHKEDTAAFIWAYEHFRDSCC